MSRYNVIGKTGLVGPDVWLEETEDDVEIHVGDWMIGWLGDDGKFYLDKCIPDDNKEGLIVDEDERIVVVKY